MCVHYHLMSVSYTHLDVYKRQLRYGGRFGVRGGGREFYGRGLNRGDI